MKRLLVFCNAPGQDVADRLAAQLVEDGLAACVNVLAPCHSVYRWQGVLETATEVPLIIKTTAEAYPALEERIKSLHPYEVPEIVACEISHGLPAYLTWVEQAVFSRV